ncbi:MAG TPA: hypothetical protein DDY89_15230 [Lysinibacillus sp.]|nr:hypothetical protein [Lysinibacillus sp.]
MTTISTLTEATRFFNEQFPEGSQYKLMYSRVQVIRDGIEANGTKLEPYLRFQRLGNQLQFLASLYDKSSDTTLKNNVKSAILATLTGLESLKNTDGQSLLSTNAGLGAAPAGGIVLAGLVMARKGVYYNLGTADQSRVASATISMANQIATWIDSSSNPNYTALDLAVNSWRNQKYGNFALNGPILHAGGLALYSDLITTHTSASQYPKYNALYKFGTYVFDKCATLDATGTKASIAIGGANTPPKYGRKFFPSSGYNGYVGMGLAWLAHGIVYTGSLSTIPGSRLINDSKKIGNFYKGVFDAQPNKKAYELSEPADFTGKKLTEATIQAVVALGYTRTEIDEMLATHTASTTGYLYTLAWNGDQTFLVALDKAVRTAGETVFLGSESTNGSSVIVAYSRTGEAAAHRAMGGFAGMLQRGISTVTDGK